MILRCESSSSFTRVSNVHTDTTRAVPVLNGSVLRECEMSVTGFIPSPSITHLTEWSDRTRSRPYDPSRMCESSLQRLEMRDLLILVEVPPSSSSQCPWVVSLTGVVLAQQIVGSVLNPVLRPHSSPWGGAPFVARLVLMQTRESGEQSAAARDRAV